MHLGLLNCSHFSTLLYIPSHGWPVPIWLGLVFGLSLMSLCITIYYYYSIADADFTDEELDVILIRRVFEGTKDIFLLMIIETTGGYFIKLKLHGVLYTVDSIVISKSVWHFISVRLAYPKSIRDLTRIIYDIIVDQ